MSDVGTYDALEAELVALVTTPAIAGVVSISPSLSVEDLIERDGIRKPAIGIVEGKMQRRAETPEGLYSIGSSLFSAVVEYEIAVVVENKRGAVNGRATMRLIVETIRDRANTFFSARAPRDRWRCAGEVPFPLHDRKDLIAKVCIYELNVSLGGG